MNCGGDLAATTAIDTLMVEAGRSGSPALVLERAFEMANERVAEAGATSRMLGLGSTLTALTIRDDLATVAHIGDSRVYRLRSGDLRLLTTDHCQAMDIGSRGPTQVLTQYMGQPDRPLNVASSIYGWFVPTRQIDPATQGQLPGDLLAAICFGRDRGFDHVLFDCDAGTTDELPVHNW